MAKRVFTEDQLARRRATGAIYHAKNREKRNAACRAYQKAHPVKRVRTAEHKARNLEASKRRYKAMRDAVKQAAAAFDAANPHIKIEAAAKRAAEQKQRAAASRRAWNLANFEKMKKIRSKWSRDHPECQANYRAAHRKEAILRSAAWRKANPERHRELAKQWAAKNPHKIRAMRIRRRAAKKGAEIGDVMAIAEWERKWKSKRRIGCFWCRAEVPTKTCETDHIVPLAKGGQHSISNLCVSCEPCNKRKNAKTMDLWNVELTEPVLL